MVFAHNYMQLLIFLLAGLFVVLIVRSTGISINGGGYAGSKDVERFKLLQMIPLLP